MEIELSIILGLFLIIILVVRSKNRRIEELDDENNKLAKDNIIMSLIISEITKKAKGENK